MFGFYLLCGVIAFFIYSYYAKDSFETQTADLNTFMIALVGFIMAGIFGLIYIVLKNKPRIQASLRDVQTHLDS